MNQAPALHQLLRALEAPGTAWRGSYRIPGLWVDRAAHQIEVNPFAFHAEMIRSGILADAAPGHDCSQPLSATLPGPPAGGHWVGESVIYAALVRTTTAWDHTGTGTVEPGSFLKTIVLVPYLERLGVNLLYLLPVTLRSERNRKGSLGSPYAVRDPYRLDSALAEPLVGLGAEIEFGAFVEAAHRLGLRVGVEFALRTAAKDSDWAAEHPEWFYWIREDAPFASPAFPERTLTELKRRVDAGVRIDLPPPLPAYRELFIHPSRLRGVSWDGRRWVGRTADGSGASASDSQPRAANHTPAARSITAKPPSAIQCSGLSPLRARCATGVTRAGSR